MSLKHLVCFWSVIGWLWESPAQGCRGLTGSVSKTQEIPCKCQTIDVTTGNTLHSEPDKNDWQTATTCSCHSLAYDGVGRVVICPWEAAVFSWVKWGHRRTWAPLHSSAELGVSESPICTEQPALIFQLPDHLWARGQSFSAPYFCRSRTLQMTQFFLALLGKAMYRDREMAKSVNVIDM